MFDTANDRLNYTELLEPDIGYKLDFAVGLTYSLDLEALLGIPVALGLLSDNDDELMKSPFYLLEAIRKSSDKLAIFCNAGSIAMSQKIMSVYSLLENSVFEVKIPNKQNFHPKLWFVKYTNDVGKSYVKLLVLSRNLTFDKSMDLCVSMQGEIKGRVLNKNKPLSDMLEYVADCIDKSESDKKQKVLMLAEDILKVVKFSTIHPFEDYEFLPLGFGNYDKDNTGLFKKKYDMVIVSPFLSDDIIDEITNCPYQKVLITRKAFITSNVLEKFSGKNGHGVYVTKEVLTDNEYGVKQDIHAKMYFTSSVEGSHLYIGSANASHNAFYNNIEFLLKLKIKHNTMGFWTVFKDLIPKDNCPFEKIEIVPETDDVNDDDRAIDKALKDAVYALQTAKVVEVDGKYDLTVSARKCDLQKQVQIAPLYRQDLITNLEQKTFFKGLLLKELSVFYTVSVEGKKNVVKIETKGMPQAERDNAIYKGIIDTKTKFLMYVSFMLSEDYAASIAEYEQSDMLGLGDKAKQCLITDGLYEKMLKIAHQNPCRLKEISDLTKRLDADVVTDEFKDMYTKFQSVVRRLSK